MVKWSATLLLPLLLFAAGATNAQLARPQTVLPPPPGFGPSIPSQQTRPPQTKPQTSPPRKDIPTIAKAAKGAVVSIIMSDKDGKPVAQGSGFLVSTDGVIVTNYHVISEGTSAIVKLPDGAFYVVDGVLAFDKARDVAIIKAHGQNFRTLTLGNSDRLQVGEDVVAIGNPLSLESTVSTGIVSGIRTIEDEGGKFLQVTAAISPGSSGGPLFNMAGEVIGITTLYLKGGENLNFAIPINDAKRLLLNQSGKLQNLPDESRPVKAQTHDPDVQSSARDYYQNLHEAGGFSEDKASFVCFTDDAPHSVDFLTLRALAYDEDYSKAADTAMQLDSAATPNKEEIEKQMGIAHAIQQKAPYVKFILNSGLITLALAEQQFFRSGGRVLVTTLYTKGVKAGDTQYQWNENRHLWITQPLPLDANANVKTFVNLELTIEPATMRYIISMIATISTGHGETKRIEPDPFGTPSGGVCEKIPTVTSGIK